MKKQFTKALAVLLTLCMLAGMMILPTGATEPETAIEPDTSWFKGYVVEKDTTDPQTYEISTAAQLLGFAKIAHFYDFAGDTVKLTADIDLNPGWDATTTIADDGTVTLAKAPANVWTAIPVFKGTLDGNGHTISGIYSASEFTVPASSNRYVGGFINELVDGTVKNLIVKNSLATFSSPNAEGGTSRIRIGGIISRVVDSNLQNIYADIDAWMEFNYHYTMGGLFCSVEANADNNVYVGTIENIVGAGCVGRIVNGKSNVKGSETEKINLGNVFGYTADDGATVTLNRISFIGWCNGKYLRDTTKNAVYTGDIVFVKDGYSTKNFSVESYSLFTNEFTNNYGNTTLSSKSWMMTDAGDTRTETYEQMGFKTITLENGGKFAGEILLPGTVVDMLNLSEFVQDTESENTKIGAATDWYGTTIPQTYYLYTPEQLFGFEEVAQIYDFAGDTVKLMADIDLNAGWDATTTIADDGTVTLAKAPANVWTAIPVFKGTLDGNGHTISGIYSASEFTVPASSNRYVGGFINELVDGTVKNLIVKNSLATFSSPNAEGGTSRIRIGGIISRVVDSNLQNIYADIDAWMEFNYHYTMGGLFCSVEANADNNVYVGTIENIVGAGCVGRIVNGKSNVKGSETEKINLGNVFGYTADDGATVTLNRISFIGWCNGKYLRDTTKNAVYTGDIVFVKDGYSTKNFSVESYSLFTNEFTNNYGNTTLSSKSWMMTDAGDTRTETYEQMGFKTITLENGGKFAGEILLPGTVVDMLTQNTSNLYLQKSEDGSKIRFVGVVNISEEEFENFSALGFDISMTYDGKTYTNTFTTTTVYKTLTANGTPVSASEYGGTYFYAVEITGLGTAASDVVFDVDGITIHTGESTKNVYGSATVTFTPAA